MKLFGRELTIKQVIGFVKCNAGSGDGLMDVAALELAGELEKVQAENTHLAKEVSSLAIESIEREKALAKLEAEVMVAVETIDARQWIPASDPPEEDGEYLGYYSFGDVWFKARYNRGEWQALSNESYSSLWTVTHWMPLPQPPKGI